MDRNLKFSATSWYLIASTPIATAFFLIPFELYFPQRSLWGDSIRLPMFFVGNGALLFALTAPCFLLLFRWKASTTKAISLLLFLLGLFILLADVFAPLQSTQLDGWALKSSEPRNLTYIELCIFTIIASSGIYFRKRGLAEIALPISIILWFASIGYFLIVVISSGSSSAKERSIRPLKPELPNIYHIVLDELQSDAAFGVIKDQKFIGELKGFHLFPFNTSSYLFTRSSFPNYMTGTTYQGKEPFADWLKIYERQGLLKSLFDKGYSITMRAPFADWDNQYVSDFATLDQVMLENVDTPLPGLGDFLPIWLARILPNFLSNEAFRLAGGLEPKLVRALGYSGRFPRAVNDGREPFASVLMMRTAINQEEALSPYGRYTYLHAVLPHGPYVMDGACNYSRQLSQKNVTSYYKQAVCGMKVVIDFLKELKRLGRYDNSIILVHADTGHGLRGLIEVKGREIISSEAGVVRPPNPGMIRYPDWNEKQLIARTLSFLMLKPIGGNNKATFSTHHSKLSDIYPTLMGLIDGLHIMDGEIEGVSLFKRGDEIQNRDNTFYLYDPRLTTPEIQKHHVLPSFFN